MRRWDIVLTNQSQNQSLEENIVAVLGKKTFDSLGLLEFEAENLK
jgi:hypothetical protein